jgi:hypothetical protein
MKREDFLLLAAVAACLAMAGLLSGCNSTAKEVAKSDYKAALNQYYQGWPRCVWPDAVAAPIQSDDPEVKAQLVGLAQAGLLKPEPVARGKRKDALLTYDLTDEGRAAWTKDVFWPGAGNFCYGRPQILSVDKSRQESPSTEIVDYHYAIPDPPAWATNAAVQQAIPAVQEELAGTHAAEALLVDTTDGYRVQGPPHMIQANGAVKPKRHPIRNFLHRLRKKKS